MAQTRKQKSRERIAQMCDEIAQGKSESGKHLRAVNRKVDFRKSRRKAND